MSASPRPSGYERVGAHSLQLTFTVPDPLVYSYLFLYIPSFQGQALHRSMGVCVLVFGGWSPHYHFRQSDYCDTGRSFYRTFHCVFILRQMRKRILPQHEVRELCFLSSHYALTNASNVQAVALNTSTLI